ncbi:MULTISPECIES: hypothetical protein [Rhodanobacter]|uniref:hypothetical protein n=1 Tax=Rhodanobacter TaxID=75309 RepID=UPI000482E6F0|nr:MULTISPECIES: hypothetical protein [Rhodanobacter]KZC20055.1 hypothetical protein RHOFW104R3_27830 [Rhodanobacter denitrificans]UJM95054.1 hypothetical protein LRK32_06355 [Rhodanobacter denitrificans]UJM98585.1 hypothetical protein LRK44_06360 [Rhodanobacter denitrificans]UJN22001.1 hypothetical protein LRK54_02135 [Rhodanobacter denitrificans]
MIVMDCESRESALASVSQIYGVSGIEIDGFLQAFDLEAHYENSDPKYPGDQELRRIFECSLDCRASRLDRVFWFHLTRVRPGADFAEGIQPLSVSLECVWQTILNVFRGTEHETRLLNMRRNGVPNFHYELKADDALHAGPYAMMVRAVATRSEEIGNHNYLWLPEIMEDICNGYLGAYGTALHTELSQALTPTIVKFWSAKRCGIDCVEAALFYLYQTAHAERLSLGSNTCFDGENQTVLPEQVVKVESLAAS